MNSVIGAVAAVKVTAVSSVYGCKPVGDAFSFTKGGAISSVVVPSSMVSNPAVELERISKECSLSIVCSATPSKSVASQVTPVNLYARLVPTPAVVLVEVVEVVIPADVSFACARFSVVSFAAFSMAVSSCQSPL